MPVKWKKSFWYQVLELQTQFVALMKFRYSIMNKFGILKGMYHTVVGFANHAWWTLNHNMRFKISVEIMEYNSMCLIIAYIPKKTILYMDLFSVISH